MSDFVAHLESRLNNAQAKNAERAMREAAAKAAKAQQGGGAQGGEGAQGAQGGQGCCGGQGCSSQGPRVDPTQAGAQNQQNGERWNEFADKAQSRKLPQPSPLSDEQRSSLYARLGVQAPA